MYVSNQLPVKLFSYVLNAILGLAQNCTSYNNIAQNFTLSMYRN